MDIIVQIKVIFWLWAEFAIMAQNKKCQLNSQEGLSFYISIEVLQALIFKLLLALSPELVQASRN